MAFGIPLVLLVVIAVLCVADDDDYSSIDDTTDRISKLIDDFYAKSHIRRAKIQAGFEHDFEDNTAQTRELVQSVGITGDVQKIADNVWSETDAIWTKIRDNLDTHFDDVVDDSNVLKKAIADAISPASLQDPLVQTYLDELNNSAKVLLQTVNDVLTRKQAVFQADLGQFVSAMWRLHAVALDNGGDDYQDTFEQLLGIAYDLLKVDFENYFDDWLLELNSQEKRNKALTILVVSV